MEMKRKQLIFVVFMGMMASIDMSSAASRTTISRVARTNNASRSIDKTSTSATTRKTVKASTKNRSAITGQRTAEVPTNGGYVKMHFPETLRSLGNVGNYISLSGGTDYILFKKSGNGIPNVATLFSNIGASAFIDGVYNSQYTTKLIDASGTQQNTSFPSDIYVKAKEGSSGGSYTVTFNCGVGGTKKKGAQLVYNNVSSMTLPAITNLCSATSSLYRAYNWNCGNAGTQFTPNGDTTCTPEWISDALFACYYTLTGEPSGGITIVNAVQQGEIFNVPISNCAQPATNSVGIGWVAYNGTETFTPGTQAEYPFSGPRQFYYQWDNATPAATACDGYYTSVAEIERETKRWQGCVIQHFRCADNYVAYHDECINPCDGVDGVEDAASPSESCNEGVTDGFGGCVADFCKCSDTTYASDGGCWASKPAQANSTPGRIAEAVNNAYSEFGINTIGTDNSTEAAAVIQTDEGMCIGFQTSGGSENPAGVVNCGVDASLLEE